MGSYNTKIVSNIICSQLCGELDKTLVNEWIKRIEEQEANSIVTLNRFYDMREINEVHLNFDELWSVSQHRLGTYESGDAIMLAFWVSTPMNYGVARMYQSLFKDTSFKIGVFYKLEEVADFLGVDEKILANITY